MLRMIITTALFSLIGSYSYAMSSNKGFICPLESWPQSKLSNFSQGNYQLTSDHSSNSLDEFSLQLLDCLASENAYIRDDISFNAYTTWLRNNALQQSTVKQLYSLLSADLTSARNNPSGVYLPFAILVYAEILRVDRITPYLSPQQLDASVNLVAQTIKSTRDYRGFSDTVGWRHQIAHSADAVLQLSLNPRLPNAHAKVLAEAISTQVAPNGHNYIFGESRRLAIPVYYLYVKGKLDEKYLQAWLQAIADSKPLPSWAHSYASELGLAKRHNTRQFLLEFNNILSSSGSDKFTTLQQQLQSLLESIH